MHREKYTVEPLLVAKAPVIKRNAEDMVSIDADGATVYYSLNDAKMKRYKKPFNLKKGGDL